ncbi:MAG: DUF3631 domain-containing protein [Chloroflexi bacterium]|nr:DUF3631 domain-containing protein [Chloroflexota bacterium]
MTYGVFSTFSAKAIAGIGKLPDTVADRAIPIVLKRKAPGEAAERFKYRKAKEEATPLQEKLEEWASASVETLTEAHPDIPLELDDRAADGWEVLLAIADMAGEDWPQRARVAALALSVGDSREDESQGVLLLSNIRDIFAERGDPDKITTANLIRSLLALEEAPWGDLKGKPLDARGLSQLLRPFTIKPGTIRLDGESTARGYCRKHFVPEWARYLPTPTLERATQASQASQASDTDSGVVTDVTDVTANTGTGERAELEA